MNRDEALELMKQGYPMQGQYFSDNEFLIWNDGYLYDEGGYTWDIKDFEERNFEGWKIWLDINNPIDISKQFRNKQCNCGSGKKYKKCCYLTINSRLKTWNEKVEAYNTLLKAIKNNTTVALYEKKTLAAIPFLESMLKESAYNIYGRGKRI